MRKWKLLFVLAAFVLSAQAFAIQVSESLQAAFNKLYPSAEDVAWEQDGSGYYVADFFEDGFNVKVWFTPQEQWVMKQTDWETMNNVPGPVFNAFAAGEYSGGEVQNVVWVQFPQRQPVVAVVVGMANEPTEYQLIYSAEGELLNSEDVTDMDDTLGAATFLH